MKKIYFLASAVVLAGSLSAQKVNKITPDAKPTSVITPSKSVSTELLKKVPGDAFWHEDFRNGLGGYDVVSASSPGAWSSGYMGATDYTSTWKYDTSGPTGQFSDNIGPLESSSAANGWMLFDVNATTDSENPGAFISADAYIQTPAIDASALPTTNIGLEIEHYFRTCCAGGGIYPVDIFVGYVDDATAPTITWKEVNSGNSSHNTTPGDGSANVEVRLIGIGDVVTSAQAQTDNSMYVRFHWNSALDASSSYYFWMIDDVKIVEVEANDARMDKMYAGDIYNDFDPYIIPQSQAHAMVAGADVTNIGGNDLTNLHLDITITEDATMTDVYTGASTSTTLTLGNEGTFSGDAANTLTNYWWNTGFSAFNLGVHTVEVIVDSDADDDNTNDTLRQKFEYSEFEFGHYRPTSPDIGVDVVNDGTSQGSQASAYAIKEDGIVYGFYVDFQDGTTVTNTAGQTGLIEIWNDAFDAVLASAEFDLTQEAIDATTRVGIPLEDPFEVFAGDLYYATLTAYGDGDMVIRSDYDGDDDNSTLLVLDQIYGASSDPYVNLNFNPDICDEQLVDMGKWMGECVVGLEENQANITFLNNTPNPATNSTRVNYSIANAGDVTLKVVDITGKVVATVNEGVKAAGAHSIELNTAEFTNGVYFYTLTAGQNQLTNKMIVNK